MLGLLVLDRKPVLSARYEYLTVEYPSNLSSTRLVWQVSRIGAPFTDKKIETKIAAANAGCRNKMKAHQSKISRQQLSSTLRQQENRSLKKNNRWHLDFQCVLDMPFNRLAFGHPLCHVCTSPCCSVVQGVLVLRLPGVVYCVIVQQLLYIVVDLHVHDNEFMKKDRNINF